MTASRDRRPGAAAAHALRFALLAAWCAAVWYLSAQSDPGETVGFELELPDWLLHGVEYLAGGVLARNALAPVAGARRGTLLAILFCLVWGVVDEWHQSHVPARDASAADAVADLFGATLGAALHALVRRGEG